MQIHIDTDARTLVVDGRNVDLYSTDAFDLLSDLWVKVGWDQRYSYSFSWLGRPIIQLPEDLVRMQEVVVAVEPDVIVETGVAHGGSAVFLAGLLQLLGGGRVVSVDIEIRPHNRAAIEAHRLAPAITLVEGDSVAPATLDVVRGCIAEGDRVLVVLDSDHSYAHVRRELDAYAPLVTVGSYIVVTDGIMRDVADTPHGVPAWTEDNPARAAEDFASEHPDFELEQPPWLFNESGLSRNITYWPSAWLRRVS